jgi:hypothetical protein
MQNKKQAVAMQSKTINSIAKQKASIKPKNKK